MAREIVLDTETTGLDPRGGHRLVEIACVELEDYLPTGRTFHRYIHPERPVDPEAVRVHGLTTAFLADKPIFADADVCEALVAFIGDATVIAHNAAFDREFVNQELARVGLPGVPESRWLDTLAMAAQRFPGVHNSLDALCKRFRLSLNERDKHGALIDARLLAAVYLELRGGRERRLDLTIAAAPTAAAVMARVEHGPRPRPLAPRSTDDERAAHLAFIKNALTGKALWLRFGLG
ncbi:MAG TPA: DNA polymerase III subunit epsilon [Caulobacteraceae bacterium]|nr:DNA polymerase III subunit epsilon [Caulobacteraceae bacterium]